MLRRATKVLQKGVLLKLKVSSSMHKLLILPRWMQMAKWYLWATVEIEDIEFREKSDISDCCEDEATSRKAAFQLVRHCTEH